MCSVLFSYPACGLHHPYTTADAYCAASAFGAHVQRTTRAPSAPSVQCCVQTFPATRNFAHSTAVLAQKKCVRNTLLCRKIADCSNFPAPQCAKPATDRTSSDKRNNGRRPLQLLLDGDKWCARGFLHDILVLNVNDTLADDRNGGGWRFALPALLGSFGYGHPAKCNSSVPAGALRPRHNASIPQVCRSMQFNSRHRYIFNLVLHIMCSDNRCTYKLLCRYTVHRCEHLHRTLHMSFARAVCTLRAHQVSQLPNLQYPVCKGGA